MHNDFIVVKNDKGELVKITVEPEVYKYVKQLEYAVKYPIRTKIHKLYPERFGDNNG